MKENTPPLKRIAILGSTGSIGQQTLDVIRAHPDKFTVTALCAGHNLTVLQQQVSEFQPRFISHLGEDRSFDYGNGHFASVEEIVTHPQVDLVLAGTAGTAGLNPVITAIRTGKTVALANKEPLVMAGPLILKEMKRGGGWILPVDSEHSAIWQCLNGENASPARIILTASGGPFLRYTREQLDQVTPEQALRHPSWQMGRKITLDSATLMNKGLEVIEARWLFDVPFDQIEVVIHPQSIIHSMVELVDGSVKAQLGVPDMRLPIQYALAYPERIRNDRLPRLDWNTLGSLQFEKPKPDLFPCLKLAVECGRKGGTFPAVLCGADEAALELFLDHQLPFTGIAGLIEKVLEQHQPASEPDLDTLLEAEQWARKKVRELAAGVK